VGPPSVIFWPSLPYLCDRHILLRSIAVTLEKKKVPHKLSFCGVMAGPIGDWRRVSIGPNLQGL
jgi:hypothetical protein